MNFVDSQAVLPLANNEITYELIFADPNEFGDPLFEKSEYRIQGVLNFISSLKITALYKLF